MQSLQGYVDLVSLEGVQGWARFQSRPRERVFLELLVAGEATSSTVADRFREDLVAAGIGDGKHGFVLPLIASLQPLTEQTLEVRAAGSCEILWSGTTATLVQRAQSLNSMRIFSLWAISRLEIINHDLMVEGYVVPHKDLVFDEIGMRFDGQLFDTIEYPIGNEGPRRLWFLPGAERLGFRCHTTMPKGAVCGDRHAVIECCLPGTETPLRPDSEFFIPADFTEQLLHVPASDQLKRVQGNVGADLHILWGYTAVMGLDRILRRMFATGIGSYEHVLDWGCGCGRLARHLVKIEGPAVTGADIDRENVAWCTEHIGGATFVELPLSPPTRLPEATFDLVIGLSVFTHLTERAQLAWLEELARTTRPQAIVLATVHGSTAMMWSSPWPELLAEWQESGFSDRISDSALDGVIEDREYYRAAFHTHDYIRATWKAHFEVVAIFAAAFDYQDLVVLRRR